MGVSRFRQVALVLFISVCVAQIYIKSWKKINAKTNFAATNVAIAA